MFEKVFGRREWTQTEAEARIKRAIWPYIKNEVSEQTLVNAFAAAQEENEKRSLGLTNNHLLNLIRGETKELIQDEEAHDFIDATLAELRLKLTEEEQRR